jgi:hypothetical protein
VEHALTAIKNKARKHAEGATFCVLFLWAGALLVMAEGMRGAGLPPAGAMLAEGA